MKFISKQTYRGKPDEELMRLVQKHNPKAFDELYLRYQQKLLVFFYNALNKDEDKAQDFLQDLFLKVMDKAAVFDTQKKFVTWLYTIASNMVKNEYRRLSVRNVVTNEFDYNISENSEDITSKQLDQTKFQQQLSIALDKLDEKQKTVFILRYQEELSLKEIGEILEISEGTVKSRLFYTLKKLNQKLYEFDPKIN